MYEAASQGSAIANRFCSPRPSPTLLFPSLGSLYHFSRSKTALAYAVRDEDFLPFIGVRREPVSTRLQPVLRSHLLAAGNDPSHASAWFLHSV